MDQVELSEEHKRIRAAIIVDGTEIFKQGLVITSHGSASASMYGSFDAKYLREIADKLDGVE